MIGTKLLSVELMSIENCWKGHWKRVVNFSATYKNDKNVVLLVEAVRGDRGGGGVIIVEMTLSSGG
jgi:hypothetical protein